MSEKIIKAIKKDIVHKICSGQVVLNLATAIKELVENSLDAKATIIEVRLREYGSELIEVIDNGTGIHPNNFEALTLKHHTSKLNDFCDLVNVETFGFRGEALSSLCAVSDMVVTTKHESEKCGSKLIFDYLGVLQDNQPCPRQTGTTVSLTNLFSSLPVRQKEFHRNLKKEFAKVVQILTAYCLIATNVKITCTNQTKKGGRLTFLSTQENKSVRENISCVFGSKQLSSLLEIVKKSPTEDCLEEFNVTEKDNAFVLEGFISSCEHGSGRSTADRQFYFINSRPCDPTKVIKLVNEVYHHYNLHQFPFVLMNIVVPKQSIDVNVTPDKRLIFLQNENILLATVKSSLTNLYENIPSTYKLNNPISSALPKPVTTDDKKLSLSVFDKWRHNKDKNIGESSKRSNQEFLQQPNLKQIKLDTFRKDIDSNPNKRCDVVGRSHFKMDSNFTQEPVKNESENCAPRPSAFTLIQENYVTTELNQNSVFVDEPVTEVNSETIEFHQVNSDSVQTNQECSVPNDELDFEMDSEVEESRNDLTVDEHFSDFQEHLEETKISSNTGVVVSSQVEYSMEICDDTMPVELHDGRKCVTYCTTMEKIRQLFEANRSRKSKRGVIINKFHAEIDPSKNSVAEDELSKAISKDMFLKMEVVGQFNLGFIITKLENDLFIVDQHATDEKYNFETLQRTTSLKSQKLVVPQSLDLTVANECVLIDSIDILRKNGFEFIVDKNADATKRVKLTSIPVSQNWQFGKEDIDEVLFMLQDSPTTLCRPSRIRAMFASRACRKSVMIGTALSLKDMKKLISHMSEIEQPWNCPHGRPTMRHLINLSLLE